MEQPDNRGDKLLIKSTDHYCFAVSQVLMASNDAWLAEAFGAVFYAEWKRVKRDFALASAKGGKAALGELEPLVRSAVHLFNKQNLKYQVTFVLANQRYTVQWGQVQLGTVQRRGALDDQLLTQTIIVKGYGRGKELVRDSGGAMIARFVYRAIGDDVAVGVACSESGMSADGVTSFDAGKNPLAYKAAKAATRSLAEHVGGKKPSVYLSFTTLEEGARNPQGKSFGSVQVKIDLLVLKQRGVSFYYMGGAEGAAMLAKELNFQKMDKSSKKTGFVQQARDDVVRTREILVEGHVPAEAVVGVLENNEVVWARQT